MFNNKIKTSAIIDAFLYGCKEASNLNKIPLKSVKRWIIVGPERKKGGGRKIKDPIMEKKILEWYNCVRNSNINYITNNMIIAKALEISKCNDFIASKGWLEKFKEKYGLIVDKEISKRTN